MRSKPKRRVNRVLTKDLNVCNKENINSRLLLLLLLRLLLVRLRSPFFRHFPHRFFIQGGANQGHVIPYLKPTTEESYLTKRKETRTYWDE